LDKEVNEKGELKMVTPYVVFEGNCKNILEMVARYHTLNRI
jgi:hypothetical protein